VEGGAAAAAAMAATGTCAKMGPSGEFLPLVSAVIFAKISFLTMVGEEHGLTDGVLLAETVLLLKKEQLIVNGRRKTIAAVATQLSDSLAHRNPKIVTRYSNRAAGVESKANLLSIERRYSSGK
jgi:hypothetical protein